jgi:excisionase family DNA binding protein
MTKSSLAFESSQRKRRNHLEPLYDSHEVALQYKLSEKSLHRWARSGMIPAVKFGRLWRFRKSAIDQWMKAKTQSQNPI